MIYEWIEVSFIEETSLRLTRKTSLQPPTLPERQMILGYLTPKQNTFQKNIHYTITLFI
jgi:hypothetical protein